MGDFVAGRKLHFIPKTSCRCHKFYGVLYSRNSHHHRTGSRGEETLTWSVEGASYPQRQEKQFNIASVRRKPEVVTWSWTQRPGKILLLRLVLQEHNRYKICTPSLEVSICEVEKRMILSSLWNITRQPTPQSVYSSESAENYIFL